MSRTKMPTIFSNRPARAILGIVSMPDPKTMAFGGVATGSMNAQLAANVTGTVRTIGSKPDSIAIAPTTGRKVAVVAVLLELAQGWMPFGPSADVLNAVFVAVVVGGVLGLFYFFAKVYPRLLTSFLEHKTAFLMVPLAFFS